MFFVTRRYVDEQIERQRVVSNAAIHALMTALALAIARSPTGDAVLNDLKVMAASEVQQLDPRTIGDPKAYRDTVSMMLRTLISAVAKVRGALLDG
jgi:hypothetical protein